MNATAIVQPRYTVDEPGLWCPNHRSVYCVDVQAWIENRDDAESLAEIIGGNIGNSFSVSFPIYPKFCIWEVVSYDGINHEMLGPMAEMTGMGQPRHRLVRRLMPGESAADLAQSLRDEYEAVIEDDIESLKKARRSAGQPVDLPRCRNSSHSMRYQKLLLQMTDPRLLHDEWDDMRESVYALMYTFHYHQMCIFCWTKQNMQEAIRVSPDFVVDPPGEPANHDDLIPDASDTDRRSRKTTRDTAPW